MYMTYKNIKQITEHKETKHDEFDLYLNENNEVELWVSTANQKILLLTKPEVTEEQYENLCYMLYKSKSAVYCNRI